MMATTSNSPTVLRPEADPTHPRVTHSDDHPGESDIVRASPTQTAENRDLQTMVSRIERQKAMNLNAKKEGKQIHVNLNINFSLPNLSAFVPSKESLSRVAHKVKTDISSIMAKVLIEVGKKLQQAGEKLQAFDQNNAVSSQSQHNPSPRLSQNATQDAVVTQNNRSLEAQPAAIPTLETTSSSTQPAAIPTSEHASSSSTQPTAVPTLETGSSSTQPAAIPTSEHASSSSTQSTGSPERVETNRSESTVAVNQESTSAQSMDIAPINIREQLKLLFLSKTNLNAQNIRRPLSSSLNDYTLFEHNQSKNRHQLITSDSVSNGHHDVLKRAQSLNGNLGYVVSYFQNHSVPVDSMTEINPLPIGFLADVISSLEKEEAMSRLSKDEKERFYKEDIGAFTVAHPFKQDSIFIVTPNDENISKIRKLADLIHSLPNKKLSVLQKSVNNQAKLQEVNQLLTTWNDRNLLSGIAEVVSYSDLEVIMKDKENSTNSIAMQLRQWVTEEMEKDTSLDDKQALINLLREIQEFMMETNRLERQEEINSVVESNMHLNKLSEISVNSPKVFKAPTVNPGAINKDTLTNFVMHKNEAVQAVD